LGEYVLNKDLILIIKNNKTNQIIREGYEIFFNGVEQVSRMEVKKLREL
jgi:hypothetical protein